LDKLVIKGGSPLKGKINISGSKNAVLPIMAATLLAEGSFKINNVPDLKDVKTMAHLLRIIGAQVEFANNGLLINTSNCNYFEAPYELVKTMRASVYVLGPLLTKFGKAKVSLPGGCAIGSRPVDLHIKGLQALGAKIDLEKGYIVATAGKLKGNTVDFDISSVGATGNLLMASVLAEGKTYLNNASREPEIIALADFLVQMGAKISGIGSDQLIIEGIKSLQPVNYEVIPDRIEAGTFLIATALTKGEVTIENADPKHLKSLISKLRKVGVFIEENENTIFCKAPETIKSDNITTAPYPGFPTDLQAQWMALMSVAEGSSVITENIFSDRFTHVAELRRLGASIETNENIAVVKGVDKLNGAPVMSTDLRASASLVLAGLVAEGQTEVLRVYHLDRGYENIEKKLSAVGAVIKREEGNF